MLLSLATFYVTALYAAPNTVRTPATTSTTHRAQPTMTALPVLSFDGADKGTADVDFRVAKSAAYLVHKKVVAEQANMRLGTAKTKTRTEVRGGGRKPYKQKGTGRARRGSSRSPLLKGGGVTFGPTGVGKARYHVKVNRKEGRLAIATALSSATGRMTLVDDLDANFDAPKTKDMVAFLGRVGADTASAEKVLLITDKRHENTYLSARNIPYLNLRTLDNINARDILNAKKVVVAKGAMETMKTRYGA
jgi:large subunit ribosomal protein L4